MIMAGVDLNIMRYCLNEIAQNGSYKKLIPLLFFFGADPNAKDMCDRPALLFAIIHRHKEIIKILFGHQADPNFQNRHGRTLLHWASTFGEADIVQMLLEYGANPNIQDEKGLTALDIATNEDVKKILLKYGAGS